MVLVGFVYRSRAWFVFSAVGRGMPSHGVEGNCGVKILFDGGVPDVREQMFHLRFVKSFLRFAAHRPQFDLSLRFPRRCRAAGRTAHRHKSRNDCFFGSVRSFECIGGGEMMGLRPLAVAHPHRTALTASCGQAQIGASRRTTRGPSSRPRGSRPTGHRTTRPRGPRGAAVDGDPGMRWGCR